jgi:Peptidase A4 family
MKANALAHKDNVDDLRVVTYDPPGHDFDPLQATSEELNRFGLLSRPDPLLEPRGFRFWESFYRKPVTIVRAQVAIRIARLVRPLPVQAFAASVASTRELDSRNWAGGIVPARGGRRFVRVSAQWRAPLIGPGAFAVNAPLPWQCSAWIGLDGARDWSRSLPQMGTVHRMPRDGSAAATDASHAFWIQWWLRDAASQEVDLAVPKVTGGDIVTCHLEVLDPVTVRCAFKNEASNETGSVDMTTTGVPGKALISVDGATAEWVVEQPEDPVSRKPFPMPDFGSVRFNQCSTTLAGPPGSGPPRDLVPTSPRLLRFFHRLESPSRTIWLAKGSVTQPGMLLPPDPQIRVDYVPNP